MQSVSTRTAEPLLLLLFTLQLHTGQSQSFLAQECAAAAVCKPPAPAQECFYFYMKSENAVTVDRKQRRWDREAVAQHDPQTVLRELKIYAQALLKLARTLRGTSRVTETEVFSPQLHIRLETLWHKDEE